MRPLVTAVLGAGQMGGGIAQVLATQAKHHVLLYDIHNGALEKQRQFMEKLLAKDVGKKRLTDTEANEALARITRTTDLDALKEASFVIEAATEQIDLKCQLLKKVDSLVDASVTIASNTSSISITKLAAATQRPDKVIGMHFMNPVPVMPLVEIITGLATSQTTLEATLQLAHACGKTTTRSLDHPGFIANRILMPYINESIFVLQEGLATREDIDKTMMLGTNVPMGPLTLADFIGLDTCLAILRVLNTQLGEEKYRPCPLLVRMVDAGWLGKKVGKGFYDYTKSL